jgi:pimeloyl-ACP methyl ester carboxylesterase
MTREAAATSGANWRALRRWRVEVAPSSGDDATSLAAMEVAATAGIVEGPVVLLAHGAGSSARFVADAFSVPMAAAGYRLVTYDLRGHAGSSPARSSADHHLDVHAADLAAVAVSIDAEVEVVGGVSLGAHAAVRAVAANGVATSAVLACLPAWLGRAVADHGPHAVVAAEVAAHGVDGMLARLRTEAELPPWLRHTLLTDYPRHDAASLAAALTALDGGEAPRVEELQGLAVPTAVVGWADDPGHPLEVAQAWAAHAERGCLVTLDLDAMGDGVTALGRAAVEALAGVAGAHQRLR